MNWTGCRNILIIRPDNMGDLLMSSPAIRALKETFKCRITVLTSPMAAEVASLIPEIDETIISPFGWVKNKKSTTPDELYNLSLSLRSKAFDAAVIFTVYSQNPLPSAMLAWMAGIPKRLSYCRENPYELINYWLPDKEPYSYLLHQVERDICLVKHIGAEVIDDSIKLQVSEAAVKAAKTKLDQLIPGSTDYIIVHAGVSELKRAYPTEKWVELAKSIISEFNIPVIFTGSKSEKPLTDNLRKETGEFSYSAAGIFDIAELAALISGSRMLISVNTGPVHIAAGLQVPVIVLYARTNPQHVPWKTENRVFEFDVSKSIQSKNEVIRFVNRTLYKHPLPYPEPSQIIPSVHSLLSQNSVQSSNRA